jgi:hypothetical protein
LSSGASASAVACSWEAAHLQVGPMPVLYYDLDRVDRATRLSVRAAGMAFRVSRQKLGRNESEVPNLFENHTTLDADTAG